MYRTGDVIVRANKTVITIVIVTVREVAFGAVFVVNICTIARISANVHFVKIAISMNMNITTVTINIIIIVIVIIAVIIFNIIIIIVIVG